MKIKRRMIGHFQLWTLDIAGHDVEITPCAIKRPDGTYTVGFFYLHADRGGIGSAREVAVMLAKELECSGDTIVDAFELAVSLEETARRLPVVIDSDVIRRLALSTSPESDIAHLDSKADLSAQWLRHEGGGAGPR